MGLGVGARKAGWQVGPRRRRDEGGARGAPGPLRQERRPANSKGETEARPWGPVWLGVRPGLVLHRKEGTEPRRAGGLSISAPRTWASSRR